MYITLGIDVPNIASYFIAMQDRCPPLPISHLPSPTTPPHSIRTLTPSSTSTSSASSRICPSFSNEDPYESYYIVHLRTILGCIVFAEQSHQLGLRVYSVCSIYIVRIVSIVCMYVCNVYRVHRVYSIFGVCSVNSVYSVFGVCSVYSVYRVV